MHLICLLELKGQMKKCAGLQVLQTARKMLLCHRHFSLMDANILSCVEEEQLSSTVYWSPGGGTVACTGSREITDQNQYLLSKGDSLNKNMLQESMALQCNKS